MMVSTAGIFFACHPLYTRTHATCHQIPAWVHMHQIYRHTADITPVAGYRRLKPPVLV